MIELEIIQQALKAEYVDVTVYIDNPEVFNEKDSSAIIHIGGSDIKVDKNNIGPFNIKVEIKNNSVRFIYDTTFNISNIHNCNVKINNTTYDTKALTEYSFDSFKKGKNEVHLTFKEYINVTVYIENPEIFLNSNEHIDLTIGDKTIKVDSKYKKPFEIQTEIKNGEVKFICDSTTSMISAKYDCDVNINGTISSVISREPLNSKSFRKGDNEVRVRFKKQQQDDYAHVFVYIVNPEQFVKNDLHAEMSIARAYVGVGRNNTGPFTISFKMESNEVECSCISVSKGIMDDVEMEINGSTEFVKVGKTIKSKSFRKGNNVVYIKFKYVPKEEEYVDATVYIDNLEVFKNINEYIDLTIGGCDIKVDSKYNKPFNIKAKIENNLVGFLYDVSHMRKAKYACDIKVNNSKSNLEPQHSYSLDSFRKGTNEVYISFKEVIEEEFVDVVLYLDDIHRAYEKGLSAEIELGGYHIDLHGRDDSPFYFKAKIEDGNVSCLITQGHNIHFIDVEIDVNGSITTGKYIDIKSLRNFKIHEENIVHIKFIYKEMQQAPPRYKFLMSNPTYINLKWSQPPTS